MIDDTKLDYLQRELYRDLKDKFGEEQIEKIKDKKLLNFVKNYASSYEKLKMASSDFLHSMPKEIAETNFQSDFVELVSDVYGKHVLNIFESRPNLTITNITDFRVFDKSFYNVFGEDFVNQMLNFDYSKLMETNYNGNYQNGFDGRYDKLMDALIEKPLVMESFKFCYEIIKEDGSIYDYARLFRTYHFFGDLFYDCYMHRNELTDKQIDTLQDIAVFAPFGVMPKNVEELNTYNERVKEKADEIINDEHSMVIDIQRAIYSRFFGVTNYGAASFRREGNGFAGLMNFYNINRLIKMEENASKLNMQRNFTDEELSILKLLASVDNLLSKINGNDNKRSLARETLIKLYNAFDEASKKENGLISARDFKSILNKLPRIYEKNLSDSLTTVSDLDKLIKNEEKGISKTTITKNLNGKSVEIPVYKLTGAKFSYLTTCLETGFNESAYGTREHNKEKSVKDFVEEYFTLEKGTGYMSTSYTTSALLSGIQFGRQGDKKGTEGDITLVMPKNIRLIAMGNQDIWTSSKGSPEVSSSRDTKFQMPFELSVNSEDYIYNEVVIERYGNGGKFSGRLIPEAIIKSGTTPHERVVEYALEMTKFLRENKLVPKDFVMPIIMVDESCYSYSNNSELRTMEQKVTEIDEMVKGYESISKYASKKGCREVECFDEYREMKNEVEASKFDEYNRIIEDAINNLEEDDSNPTGVGVGNLTSPGDDSDFASE